MSTQKKHRLSNILWIGLLLPLVALACRVSIPTAETSVVPEIPPAITTPITQELPALTVPQVVQDEQSLLIALYQNANPAVVNITVYSPEEGILFPSGQGSGFLYDLLGNIITNAHVVHGADQIEVRFWDGSISQATLSGEDLNSDLAVLNVKDIPEMIQPLPLGNLNDVLVGQTVVAIGNPFGYDGTLTRGIISAIGRTIPALTPFSIPEAIQTDAPINPGNSGGPLLNLQGQVIGVNAQIETDGENRANSGVGFAIPVSIVQRVVPELIANGSYDWAWLGVRGIGLTPTIAQAMNLSTEQGAYLTDILRNGPAQKAGLRGASEISTVDGRQVPVGGDVITAINDVPISSFDDLLVYIALESSPGEEVKLSVLREGKPQTIVLKLEARPSTMTLETEEQP